MPGPTPKPPDQRANRRKPYRGEWQPTAGEGWQHGPMPKPPPGLLPASRETWKVWMGSWVAVHWTPMDLPMLRLVIRLLDLTERNEYRNMTELRQLADTYGITPKGQQDRRWAAPKAAEPTAPAVEEETGPYTGLSLVKAG